MTGNAKRNKDILLLLKTRRLSYGVIAEMLGTTRCAVAGVAFRARHPGPLRISSPNAGRGRRNKIGTGWVAPSYWPEKTTINTR